MEETTRDGQSVVSRLQKMHANLVFSLTSHIRSFWVVLLQNRIGLSK